MSRSHLALLIAYGPEVRAFIHSGLAARLAERRDVTVIARLAQAGVFALLDDVRVAPMPARPENRCLTKLRSWTNRVQGEWLRGRGRAAWAHYLSTRGRGQSVPECRVTAVAAMHGLTPSLRWLERWGGRAVGTVPEWREVFGRLGIDGVLASGYASPHLLPALQTAANLGMRTLVATNSWKDVYTATHVPVVPDRLLVWSERARTDLLAANPQVPAGRLRVAPSLHLEPFLNPPPRIARDRFCGKVGLDPARPFVCYSAASPAAVLNEECVVGHLLDAIAGGAIAGRPQVLVRLNPMEDGSRFRALAGRRDLVIQKPEWEWERDLDWCCALPADVRWWVACVSHAALNVSVASTVTLEFAALGKPVVNVCFDLPEPLPPEKSTRRFWEAEFYAEIREGGLAMPANSPEELVACVNRGLAEPPGRAGIDSGGPSPVDRLLEIVGEVLPE